MLAELRWNGKRVDVNELSLKGFLEEHVDASTFLFMKQLIRNMRETTIRQHRYW